MENSVYVFDLKLLCGGYAYYSTFTMFIDYSNHHREIREPSIAIREIILKRLSVLGHTVKIIKSIDDYDNWLYTKGWALATIDFAREYMPQWLKRKTCISSPLGVFTDIEIVSTASLKRSYTSRKKDAVLNRDGLKCLLCKEVEDLTMQHVIPFSQGGETSSRNLVTLCLKCNQALGAERLYELYTLAGLHQGYDPSLANVKGFESIDLDAIRNNLVKLSHDLMNTRCEVW